MGTDANKPTRIDSDRNWTQFGQTDPYCAVVTDEKYRRGQLSADHLAEFFETGRRHVEWTFGMIHRHFQPDLRPRRALDFGCGVGRLVIPLAARCEQVVGADIAPGMLEEAKKNCAQRNITNEPVKKLKRAIMVVEPRKNEGHKCPRIDDHHRGRHLDTPFGGSIWATFNLFTRSVESG